FLGGECNVDGIPWIIAADRQNRVLRRPKDGPVDGNGGQRQVATANPGVIVQAQNVPVSGHQAEDGLLQAGPTLQEGQGGWVASIVAERRGIVSSASNWIDATAAPAGPAGHLSRV